MKYLAYFWISFGIALALSAPIGAQSSDSEGPIVRPELINKITESVYVIPDNSVRLVPNIGIVVGPTSY